MERLTNRLLDKFFKIYLLIYAGTYNLLRKYGKSRLGVVMPALIRC
jgi:hypothetical protein